MVNGRWENSIKFNESRSLGGVNDVTTAMSENVITDVDTNGTFAIPAWALASSDTDPDATDHLSVNSIGLGLGTGGNAALSGGDALFTDDATLGGSFRRARSYRGLRQRFRRRANRRHGRDVDPRNVGR